MQIGWLGVSRARRAAGQLAAALIAVLLAAPPARAELVVSQLVVEFKPGESRAADIEILNNGEERTYVAVEPREIVNPGDAPEQSFATPDPSKLGLLASPARFILEPRQRRTLRIAAIGAAAAHERVYRVTVKPVSGDVTGEETGLKLLVGYDLLVLVRPSSSRALVRAERKGADLILTNEGNSSVELTDGKQCDLSGKSCEVLPAKRLYAGGSWKQKLPKAAPGEYRVRSLEGWSTLKF